MISQTEKRIVLSRHGGSPLPPALCAACNAHVFMRNGILMHA